MSRGILLKLHDAPIKYPMDGISFHATSSPVDRVWWDGANLEIVTEDGNVWTMDWPNHRWQNTENVFGKPLANQPKSVGPSDTDD